MYSKRRCSADELTSPGASGLAGLVLTWYAARGPSCGRRIESDRDRLQGVRPEIGCGYLWVPRS
jgi:hypothetical protein